MRQEKTNVVFAVFLTLAVGVTISSCNGSPNSIDPNGPDAYLLQAYLLRDMEKDVAASRVFFQQENQPTPSGPVDVDTTRMDFLQTSGLFQKEYLSANAIDTGLHTLKLQDDGNLVFNGNLRMTGDFNIGINSPFNRIYTGGGSVVVQLLSSSVNASGYLFAAVKAGQEYTGAGWAGLLPSLVPSGTFPPSVFQDTANNLDTGLYYIYMYAFNGSPRIDSITTDLPTVLPDSVFADNLALSAISGALGTISVSRHDSLFVQQL